MYLSGLSASTLSLLEKADSLHILSTDQPVSANDIGNVDLSGYGLELKLGANLGFPDNLKDVLKLTCVLHDPSSNKGKVELLELDAPYIENQTAIDTLASTLKQIFQKHQDPSLGHQTTQSALAAITDMETNSDLIAQLRAAMD